MFALLDMKSLFKNYQSGETVRKLVASCATTKLHPQPQTFATFFLRWRAAARGCSLLVCWSPLTLDSSCAHNIQTIYDIRS